MLAGNIVQVRPERKALSAAVSPTCCSGREQRSKTAYAGGAISLPPTTLKAALRRQLRAARRGIPAAERARRAALAARAVARLPAFRAGARVSVYLPFDGEIDTAVLIRAALRRGVRLYVPTVVSRRHRTLRFSPLTARLRRGTFGIRVPHHPGVPVAPRWLNLMVIPLVGVDTQGRRLGFGGGFYDHAVGFRRLRRAWKGPLLVGFAFDCQKVGTIDARPWDLRLDALATESGLHANYGPWEVPA